MQQANSRVVLVAGANKGIGFESPCAAPSAVQTHARRLRRRHSRCSSAFTNCAKEI
jgi:hypothetical protein